MKLAHIGDVAKLNRIRTEWERLNWVRIAEVTMTKELASLIDALLDVNKRIWAAEDTLRQYGDGKQPIFISAARAAYQGNDARAALKRRIDELCGSEIVEEKSYASAGRPG